MRFRRPYCARHTSVSWNLIIGKNPLFVSRQHGHSVTTMWRTYAAWMEGALESDIALIQAAMNRDGRSIERASNTRTELTLKAPAVAGLGTRLASSKEAAGAFFYFSRPATKDISNMRLNIFAVKQST